MSRGGVPAAGRRLLPPPPRWSAPIEPTADEVDRLVEALRLPRALCAVLAVRGFQSVADAKRLLRPELNHLHDPEELADGPKAADRIAAAISIGERIFVHGDYDVDGICATALLTRLLRSWGGDVVPFVPHRLRDGYDFSAAGLAAAREARADLIVTADCGSVAHETVAAAVDSGMDVIVTDHHTVGPQLPPALAVVNPQRPDCTYPDSRLCGTAVAWRLAEMVGRRVAASPDDVKDLLDLVALATVADLVPLRGENRVLVHFGLRRFRESRVAGIRALLDVCGVDAGEVDAGKLGFQLGPRINAVGRMGDAGDALAMLLDDDEDAAIQQARALDEVNRTRREEDERTLREAMDLLEEEYDPEQDRGVVLAREGWHPGVIGIVASRVVELIHRPVVLIALDGQRGRGSARSIPGFHLYEAIAACSEHLDRFGGHRQAAGLDILAESVADFRSAFDREARARIPEEALRPTLYPDLDVTLAEADLELVRWLRYLGPHGIGHRGPVFRARGVWLERPKVVGERHLKVALKGGATHLEAIGFGLAARFPPAEVTGRPWDVLFRLEKNEWRGRVTAQAKLVDLHPS